MKKARSTLLTIVLCLAVQFSFAEKLDAGNQAITQDIASMLFGNSQNNQVESTPNGIYVESKFCKKETALSDLLKNKMKIQNEQELIGLFNDILCAPRNDQIEVDLSPFIEHLQDPLLVDLVTYSGMVELGKWSLDNSPIELSSMSARNAKMSMLGLNPDSTIPAVAFWQVISKDHVRVWYGRFRMAPSDVMTYDFKFEHKKWMLIKLWMSSRL